MRRAVVLAALAIVGLTACGSHSRAASSPAGPVPVAVGTAGDRVVQVVAAENVWGDVARQVGGTHAAVTSIITDPNADPHTYETDPRNAAAVSRASFVVLNGLGYDDFASRLLAASPNPRRTVVRLDKVNSVGGDNPNPHLWYSPAYVRGAADAIAAQLGAVDPADAAGFRANERRFLAGYQAYVDELGKIKAKDGGTKVAYTERVPGYLVDAAGLVLGTPASFSQSVEDGNDPSPLDTATFNADITGHTVKVLLYNGQVTDAQTTAILGLARKAGVPVVGVTETLPRGMDFQGWQLAQATAVYTALGG